MTRIKIYIMKLDFLIAIICMCCMYYFVMSYYILIQVKEISLYKIWKLNNYQSITVGKGEGLNITSFHSSN